GMPNFRGTRHGVVTRIARVPFAGRQALCGVEVAGVHVEAIALEYDHARWRERFLAAWPEGSSAHVSYFRRIAEGPPFALETAAVFFALYVVVTGLSLPGAAIMTLVAGAIFGLLWGTVIVSFASTIGATLAFLVSRYLLRDWVQGKFGDKLKTINQGVEREG